MPARDAAQTLPRALDSLLAQTLDDFELIVIDDRSRDATARIATDAARRDPRIVVIDAPEPGGLVPALQAGHARARGALIARHDADDVAHPERFAEQVALLDDRPDVAVCGCGVRIVGAATPDRNAPRAGFTRYERWINALTEPEAIARERFVESPIVHPTALMRREAFEAVGGYRDPGWPEDYDLWLRLIEAGHRFAKTPRVLLDWHDGPTRLTRTSPIYNAEAFRRARAHYLARIEAVRRRGVAISGVGRAGKRLAHLLVAHGVCVHAFHDVHPGRVGRTAAGGVTILHADALTPASATSPIQLAAVGRVGGRADALALFSTRGYTPGLDCFAVA